MAQECETLDTRRFQGWTIFGLVTMKSLLSGFFFGRLQRSTIKRLVLRRNLKLLYSVHQLKQSDNWVSGWVFWVDVQPADPWILRSSEWFWWFRYNLMVHPRFSGPMFAWSQWQQRTIKISAPCRYDVTIAKKHPHAVRNPQRAQRAQRVQHPNWCSFWR